MYDYDVASSEILMCNYVQLCATMCNYVQLCATVQLRFAREKILPDSPQALAAQYWSWQPFLQRRTQDPFVKGQRHWTETKVHISAS